MPNLKNQPPIWLSPGVVTAAYPEKRLVNVKWRGAEIGKQNVIVINDFGSYGFPKVGDTGLVIGNGTHYYFIGKIEYGYEAQIKGFYIDSNTKKEVKIVDPDTGSSILARKVKEGEIFLGNFAKRVWMNISGNGDFSFMNGLNDGLKYLKGWRLFRLAGQTISMLGNGVEVAIGSCMRQIPMLGDMVFPDETQKSTAPEFFVELKKAGLKTARLHLGYVRNMLGIDELSTTFGARIKALIEVCTGGLPVAVLKMDEAGNIEMSTNLGIVLLDALTFIKLGGVAAVHPAVFGDSLLTWLNTHTHPTSTGPSGFPVTLADPSLLSTKVQLG